MALVVRGNRQSEGIGGHISTYASAATLYEVGLNHFFRAPTEDHPVERAALGDLLVGAAARADGGAGADVQIVASRTRRVPGGYSGS